MYARFALVPFTFVFALLACGGAIEGVDDTEGRNGSDEATSEWTAVTVDGPTGQSVSRLKKSGGTCECDLAAGSKVWKCNGQCSDKELANLPH